MITDSLRLGTILLVFIAACLPGLSAEGEYRPPQRTPAAQLVEDHADHRTHRRTVDTLGHTIEHGFAGTAADLNAFLADAAGRPNASVTVYLTGPRGLGLVVPLTAEAAQTPAPYDWQVQIQQQHKVLITIPLASRIPFAAIDVPDGLPVEAYASAPAAARTFARLREPR